MSAREAWEYIAPELPPNWSISEQDGRFMACTCGGLPVCGYARGHQMRHNAVYEAWWHYGTDRRYCAEYIAPERVREVAEELGEVWRFAYAMECGLHFFNVSWSGLDRDPVRTKGPDICTAAWACMLAMTEAMPEAERAELLGVSVELLREALEVGHV